jgi:SET domain-containing protein
MKKQGIGLHRCSTIYRLFNHSKDPNCILTPNGTLQTLKAIGAGEELTLNYHTPS